MTSDLDILRSAKLLIDQHGEGADLEAALPADATMAGPGTGWGRSGARASMCRTFT